jgi:hypothetical protein
MYSISAPTIRRASWNLSSFESAVRASEATIRLCSRAKSVWIAVSATFSFARTSPATSAFSGVATSAPIRSTGGAGTVGRALARGRYPPGSRSDAWLFAGLPSPAVPARSQSSRALSTP